jgi:hypothetical protein
VETLEDCSSRGQGGSQVHIHIVLLGQTFSAVSTFFNPFFRVMHGDRTSFTKD